MPVLTGVIVDLVPFDAGFQTLEHKWENSIAAFWGDMGNRQFLTQAGIRSMLSDWVGPEARDPKDHATFGMMTKDGTRIGLFVIHHGNSHHRGASLGAMIGEPDYWGGGYGTDALLLGVDFAFHWLDARRIHLTTMALNERVTRQVTRVGFRLEQRKRHGTWVDGKWIDTLHYGLLRAEWAGREALIAQHDFLTKWGVN